MSKDSYWFKHDSSAGRGMALRKVQAKFGHEGKGLYWDVIETLREQSEYKHQLDEEDLSCLMVILGYNDWDNFLSWMNYCIKVGLFIEIEEDGLTFFASPVLSKNMSVWETKKLNGSKGGRGNKKKTETKPKQKLNESGNNNTEWQDKILFEEFRKEYPGTKRGLETEFENFKKKTKDYRKCLPLLHNNILQQVEAKKILKAKGEFVPEWKNLQTYLNQRCWEEEIKVPKHLKPQEKRSVKDVKSLFDAPSKP